ncbi:MULTISPECIES: GPP34 family phosphoprotein [unclassified Crossiella]|uniref:GOLPH3/VPS74 family protein n=1 Tax=unclassified Crossiella TaxID=2620835 RepID=UPI001FFF75BC|nr:MULTISPECIES: GPP34 family phosphoprotein [unclassified Crossiella]MCK2243591.1 GPP34 family phosphoprotein [Crossiella sp. S99.2]MCK2257449.1 GPP34 family phosphoprotein [Crossiella sp. S99.1]
MNLAEQLFLLACDPEKQRVPERDKLGYVLRAAALSELVLRGCLTDVDDRPTAGSAKPTRDQLLDEVLAEISRDKPRKWRYWVRKNHTSIVREVQAALARAGAISVRQRRILGLFPSHVVTVHDPVARAMAVQRVRAAVTGTGALPPADAALAALAATGELKGLLTARERKASKQRIQELLDGCGPAGPALRKAIQDLKAAATSGGGG